MGPGWELSLDPDGMRVLVEETGTIVFTLFQPPLVAVSAKGP